MCCTLTVLVAACGDNAGGPATFLHQNVRVTEFAFPATAANGHASALLVIRNDNDTRLPAIATAITGDGGFAIDPTQSTCTEGLDLVPHDLCTVFVRWDAGNGDASAALVIDSRGTESRLPIHGTIGQTGDIVADTSAIDFGIVPLGNSATAEVRITNTGTDAATILLPQGELFRVAPGNCVTDFTSIVLAPGASCTPTIGFSANVAGWVSDVLHVGATVQLDAYGVRGIALEKHGSGTGRIVSVPHGIDCGADCGAQAAYIINDATLFETPDDGSNFAGWKSTCGTDPTCVIPERSTGGVVATFAGADARAVTLAIAGAAQGQIVAGKLSPLGAFEQLTTCLHTCTTYVPAGDSLEAYAFTPSHFGGWTGACAGTDVYCALTVTGDVTATAAFDKDDREVVTLLPQLPMNANMAVESFVVAFASDGDLVIGSRAGVTKLGLDGRIRWSVSTATATLPISPVQITTTPAGDIYFVVINTNTGDQGVTILSAAGAIRSSGFASHDGCALPKLVVSPNGDVGLLHAGVVAGQSTDLFTVTRPGGSVVFEQDLGQRCLVTVTVGQDGVYQVLLGEQTGLVATSFVVQRYDPSGVQLPGSGPYVMTGERLSAADAGGALAFHIALRASLPNNGGIHTFGRILRNGTLAFATTTTTNEFGGLTRIGTDPAGNLIVAREVDHSVSSGGLLLEQRSPSGTLMWALEKSPDISIGGFLPIPFVFEVADVATSNTGQIAVVGTYSPFYLASAVPWIAVYQMP